ncbi:MAG: TonB-dependent receptor [Brevundimonas sp.]
MTNRKRVFWATTALFSGLLVASAASAQSSGTVATEATELGSVVVTGVRGPFTTDGTIVAESVAKTRSTITQEFISTQNPGQTILQTLNLIPGLNFVNADPYGNSGGNIRMRGFDGSRVSLTFDGVPLNDTGNYATYTNQQLDPELIERASVNQGTTDVDSPTASATGGTINYTTARPLEDAGLQFNTSIGEFNYRRIFARADSGAFGPWGTTGYLAASYTNYDKFKGPGELEKQQYNGRLYQDLGDGDFTSLSFNWNVNRNDFYNNFINKAQFESGAYLENDIACIRPVGVNGTTQNESSQATRILSDGSVATGSCTNYHGLRINPSNTGNIRGQFSYGLTDNIRFTFDPSFQYVIANGGGFTLVQERDDRLDLTGGNTGGPGVDLNGDGDVLDNVGLYTPSNTNTHRYGIISSLIWDLNDDHRLRAAYTLDYGRHRQTGEATRFGRDSEPLNVFGGQERWGSPDDRVFGVDGSVYRSRDRFSIAQLNQFALEYRGDFFADAVTVSLGARAPFFVRKLNQNCYSQDGRSTVRCTTETPSLTLPNGNVRFGSTGSTEWIAPYSAEIEYDAVLPNAGVVWRFAEGHSLYTSYAEGISVPRTDNLYQPARAADGSLNFSTVQPESTQSYDFGYRFRNDRMIASAALWYTDYQNRIVSSRDNDPASAFFGEFIDRNLGAVEQMGVDAQMGWEVTDRLTIYGSVSWNDSEVQDDLETSPGVFLPTGGKKLVETPEWTYSARIDWQPTDNLSLGLQGKFVDDRFSNDVNSETFDGYTVVDFDARYDLTDTFGIRDAFVQVNVTNLFDEEYLGNISTSTDGFRTGSLGSPRTAVISLGTSF